MPGLKYPDLVVKIFFTMVLITFFYPLNAAKKSNILIFDSYHEGFDWSDTLISVLKSELKKSELQELELYIEHLDSKRFSLSDTSLFEFIHRKYFSLPFDLVITCDNFSLDLLLKYDALLFRNVPVIFTGINNFSNQLIQNKEHFFTGVTESHDIGETLRLISKLQPEVQNVLVIHDNTASGKANKHLVEKSAAFFSNLNCHYTSDLSTEELLQRVEELDKRWVILLASFHRDRLNQYLTAQQAITLIASRAKVPVYGINDNNLGYGVLGGNMISARVQGRMAAQYAIRILSGERPENLPVLEKSNNQFMFDYNQLRRFKIDSSLLPRGSVVINQPQPFYMINKRLLWGVITAGGALTIFSLFLLINIDRRKKAENDLRESEATIRQIAENIREAYWLRAEDKIYYVSPAFNEIFGRPREEFIANPEVLLEYIYEEDKHLIKLTVDSTSNNLDLDRELRIVHPSGGVRWIRYRSFPIKNSIGKIYRVAEVAEDITVRKITRDEILKAQKLESLGLLAGGIAHDFNNLLSGVMGYLDLARISVSSGSITRINENLEDALNVCRSAKDLTNRLLTFSKGGVPVKRIKSLVEIVKSAVDMVGANYSRQIICNLPSDLPLCNIDEGLVRQVFYNIILNGCQAVQKTGTVRIDAESKSEMHHGETLSFISVTIRDNGSGIKKENLSKIFDPFFTTKAKGNGLGLSAAYSIIANHEGTIRVESEEGKWTVFTITIPAVSPSLLQKSSQSVSLANGNREMRVLWLDDEPFITKMAENILSNYGYRVITTTSSKMALEFFQDSMVTGDLFDIVVLDLNIKGGLGGKEVIKLMLEQYPDITAVACSGYYDDPVMSDPTSYGFKYALRKPYSAEELHNALQFALHSNPGYQRSNFNSSNPES